MVGLGRRHDRPDRTELFQRRANGGIEADRGVQKEPTVAEPDNGHAAGQVTKGKRKLELTLEDPQTRGEGSERRPVCARG